MSKFLSDMNDIAPQQTRALDSNMSETIEDDATPDESSTEDMQGRSQGRSQGVEVGVLATSTPSTADSTTETIGSTAEVHHYEEWDLFSDCTSDQHHASDEETSAGDNDEENSMDGGSDEEVDQQVPNLVGCNPQPRVTNISIESALVQQRSERDDTDRHDSAVLDDDATLASESLACGLTPTSTDNDEDIVQSSASQDETTTSLPEESADESMRRRIQVLVRVRPSFESEDKVVVTTGGKEGSSLCVQATTSQGSISTVTECTFDRVFMESATQEDVFAAVEPSVQACLEGYNATIFAYGQTGTGKTHTLFGRDLGVSNGTSTCEGDAEQVKSSWGIVPRTLSYLLDQTAVLKQKNCQVELHMSFLQIYNDRLFDLLTDRMRQRPLLIREQPTLDGTTSVTVHGLSSERITSFSNAMQIIHQGHTNRCVRETESNLSSSRSHAIVQLHVTTQCPATNGEGQVLRRARLNLVDLAGSEKWNTDVEMEDAHSQELKNINTSLSALGNCIAALTEAGRKHIPYRDSTLTRVLQDSFGGNTQSCLIATVNATQQSSDETIRTLHFADRARSVMQTIRVNEVADGSTELLMAKIQIVKLRERLESEQRRRHETRLKEHQMLQRDYQEKLKGKDKEITKLMRDNAVFQRWREEDVKKIRVLESRVKDLEHQIDTKDNRGNDVDAPAEGPKRRSALSVSTTAVKYTPMQKTRSRENLTRTGSGSGTAARTYKQVLERYALGSSKGQQRTSQPSRSAFVQPQRDKLPSYDGTNQRDDSEGDHLFGTDMSSPMKTIPQWETRVDDSEAGESMDTILSRHPASKMCVSPLLCPPTNELDAQASITKHSWTYSNLAATTANGSREWASSVLSNSRPAIMTQKQESNGRRDDSRSLNPANGSISALKQGPAPLLKNASTGSLSYNSALRTPAATSGGAIEPCQKHKLAGCMLCSVNDSFRQAQAEAQAAPGRQPPKTFATSTASSALIDVARKANDGSCERHQLLRCFICMKDSASSLTGNAVQVASTSSSAPSSYSYSIPASSSTGKSFGYQSSALQGETQTKCALHSLANCILCAGVKAMTRKVVGPTPQASPAKAASVLNARSGIVTEDRYRRFTLDERILNYQTQAKLATQW